jgi:hypothetical protein
MIFVRIEKRHARPARRDLEVLPLDPRDPDIVRAKHAEVRSTRTSDRRVNA